MLPSLGIDPAGVDREFMVPLTRGLGEDAEDLEELGAYSVYGLLVPEDGTLFNVGYSVEVGGDVVDLVASGLDIETDGVAFIPEPGVLGVVGIGLLGFVGRRGGGRSRGFGVGSVVGARGWDAV